VCLLACRRLRTIIALPQHFHEQRQPAAFLDTRSPWRPAFATARLLSARVPSHTQDANSPLVASLNFRARACHEQLCSARRKLRDAGLLAVKNHRVLLECAMQLRLKPLCAWRRHGILCFRHLLVSSAFDE
tara:strand:+ start:2293 stop:2685 length:393 start_codon:yes stop_codon:yes gene_type:complete